MLVPKEIIRPGTYWYMNPETGEPCQLTATVEDLRYWYEQGNKMREAGLSIPLPFEHQQDARPLTKAERAAQNLQNNAGWVDKFVLHKDRLFGLCEIDEAANPGILAKLPRTIKYTSPWITSFTDGDGRAWKGVIGHLALTSRPRITRQEPFKDVAAALSISLSHVLPLKSDEIKEAGLYLSRAGLLVKKRDGSLAPDRPKAFSIWSGVELARSPDNPVIEPKREGNKPPEEKPPEGKKPSADKKPPEHDYGKNGDVDSTLMEILCDALDAVFGIQLPEETSEETLAQDILKALFAHLKGEGIEPELGDEEEEKDELEPNNPAKGEVMQESPPLYMSLEEVQKITDPAQKRMAEMILSLQGTVDAEKKRSDALAKNTLDAAAVRRNTRVETLCKRLPVAVRDKLLGQVKGAALSLGDDGAVIDPLASMLEMLEESTRNIPALLSANAGTILEQPQPRDYDGSMTEERRQQIVKEQSQNAGVKSPY